MTNMGAGVYQYTFDEPAPSLTYSIVETVTFQDQPVVFQFTQRGNSNVEIGTGPVPVCHYGDVTDADAYFANRLHACAWTDADPADQPKALWAATQIIDTLNFKGVRHSLWTLLQEYPDRCFPFGPHPTGAQLRQAEQEQPLEFLRGSDTTVPTPIVQACYEIAFSLLDGKDPELELEALGIVQQGYGTVQTTFNRNQVPLEHLINGVPNALAWRLIRPFLCQSDQIKLSRIS